jgi:hypothetical protein
MSFETVAGERYVAVSLRNCTTDGDLHHFFVHPVSDPFASTTTAFYPRFFAHVLLDRLPSDALPEVLEFLANAWLFYGKPPEIPPALGRKPLKGKIIRRTERPAYRLPDEE